MPVGYRLKNLQKLINGLTGNSVLVSQIAEIPKLHTFSVSTSDPETRVGQANNPREEMGEVRKWEDKEGNVKKRKMGRQIKDRAKKEKIGKV